MLGFDHLDQRAVTRNDFPFAQIDERANGTGQLQLAAVFSGGRRVVASILRDTYPIQHAHQNQKPVSVLTQERVIALAPTKVPKVFALFGDPGRGIRIGINE